MVPDIGPGSAWRGRQGVTLVELIAALAIVAILTSVAVPSFSSLYHDAERTSAVNNLLHALFLARSESIKRHAVVSLCRSADSIACANASAGWNVGWMVFVNLDRDDPPQRDAGEPVIAIYKGWPAGTITSNRPAYSFRPVHQLLVNGTLLFCDREGGTAARAIIISPTGRPRVSRRDSDNQPLHCG
jgi:type IV fimbrial biogenesis protein FimT